ncbi:MAG: hypothetical protein IKB34_01350 [Clostridia bacterium]|nr:hypothetical protein [Clostridia bacterium]
MAIKRDKNGKIKRRLGDRFNGRRLRTLPPMMYAVPFIMKERSDSQNYFKSRVDMDVVERFLRKCKQSDSEKLRGLGFMHLLVAAYVRTVSQKPAINRFIAGQRIYSRTEITLSMVVKKSMELNAQESTIKVNFQPTDTIEQVYDKMEEKIAIAKSAGDTNSFDRLTRKLFVLPAIVFRGFVALLRFMDYLGIMPKALHRVSPFHASFFITNLGSLGIPPIYHHLYNFGDLPLFISFGNMYREKIVDREGNERTKKYLDYTVVMDERITDGHYYSSALKSLEYYMRHPEELLVPPETVVDDIE